jgi:hypothetical protein
MRGAVTVALGGRDFAIRPLTLRQLRDLGVALATMQEPPAGAAEREKLAYDRMVEGLAIALRRDAPEMTADAIYDLEATLPELRAAWTALLAHSGLVPAGEAPAAAASAGATSTAS